jgi:hypothetical protein
VTLISEALPTPFPPSLLPDALFTIPLLATPEDEDEEEEEGEEDEDEDEDSDEDEEEDEDEE